MVKKRDNRELIVGLDIGTSKVAAVVGEFNAAGELNVVGFGVAPSQGLSRGAVINIDATVQSIRKAVEDAEIMAGCEINCAYTGIADRHMRSLNSEGMTAIRDREVTEQDVHSVIAAAKTVALPADQQILHILPQEFKVDHEEKIREPLGMAGVRLEAKIHMITGTISAAQNIAKCVKRCGLEINDIVLGQLASSHALLSEDEKNLGVCLIDVGAGATHLMVFAHGVIQHTAVLPVAGDQITNDIAIAFRVPSPVAEQVKVKYGCAIQEAADPDCLIDLPSMANRPARSISQAELAEVIQPRCEEICELIQAELQKHHLQDMLHAGFVLTGGSAKMPYLLELAEHLFALPVRLGLPQQVTGISDVLSNPIYSTSVGLLMYAEQQQREHRSSRTSEGVKGILGRMKRWVKGNF